MRHALDGEGGRPRRPARRAPGEPLPCAGERLPRTAREGETLSGEVLPERLLRWPQRRSQARRLLGQLKVTENAPDDGALRQVCQHPSLARAPWAREDKGPRRSGRRSCRPRAPRARWARTRRRCRGPWRWPARRPRGCRGPRPRPGRSGVRMRPSSRSRGFLRGRRGGERVGGEHHAVGAAPGRRGVVVARDQGGDWVSSWVKAARSAGERKRISVSMARVARALFASRSRCQSEPTSRTRRAPSAMR